jgi:hypothetical protein
MFLGLWYTLIKFRVILDKIMKLHQDRDYTLKYIGANSFKGSFDLCVLVSGTIKFFITHYYDKASGIPVEVLELVYAESIFYSIVIIVIMYMVFGLITRYYWLDNLFIRGLSIEEIITLQNTPSQPGLK